MRLVFWRRPGARTALRVLSTFATQHVFTTAQGSYAQNILDQLSKPHFASVMHRGLVPHCVHDGKDLQLVTSRLDRVLLFDDRIGNFVPQGDVCASGVHVHLMVDALVQPARTVSTLQHLMRETSVVSASSWSVRGGYQLRFLRCSHPTHAPSVAGSAVQSMLHAFLARVESHCRGASVFETGMGRAMLHELQLGLKGYALVSPKGGRCLS